MRTPLNLRRSSCWLVHQFEFSNTVDDPIEVEEMEDPSKSSEQESAFGEKASSEKDSRDISSACGLEKEMVENSLYERATAVEEGEYEHTSQPALSLPPFCSPYFSFFCIFHLFLPYIFHFSRFH